MTVTIAGHAPRFAARVHRPNGFPPGILAPRTVHRVAEVTPAEFVSACGERWSRLGESEVWIFYNGPVCAACCEAT